MKFVLGLLLSASAARRDHRCRISPVPLFVTYCVRVGREGRIKAEWSVRRDMMRGGFSGMSFAERLVNPVMNLALTEIPVEHYRIRRIIGDGRCMFRALAQGVSRHKNIYLTPTKEEQEADNLRMAVQEALCRSKDLQYEFRDVIQTLETPLKTYCKQLKSPTFWGGEPEMLVLSKLLKTPIHVYKNESEFGSKGIGFVKIVEYGRDPKHTKHPPVRLLYSGSNHYDLLL